MRTHSYTLLITLALLAAAVFTIGITTIPATTEANHCSGGDIHASNGYCYSEAEMCDAGWNEYCEDEEPNCSSGEVLASNGYCYSEAEMCEVGHTQYCASGGGAPATTCSSGKVLASNGNCYTPAEMCNAGWTQYCKDGSGFSGQDATIQETIIETTLANCTGGLPQTQLSCTDGENTYTQDPSGNATLYIGDGQPCGYDRYIQYKNGQPNTTVYETIPASQCADEGDTEDDPNSPATTDICPNLPGTQTSVPQGYTYQSGQCVESTTSGPCTEQRTGTGKGSTTQTICNCPAGYIQQGSTCVAQPNQDPTDNPNNPNNPNQPENNEPWDGKVFLIPVDTTAHESGNTASFRVAINGSRSTPLDVGLTFRGTATQYTDYTLQGGGIQGPGDNTATIAANQTQSGLIILTPVDDDIYEGTETVRPTLRDLAGYNLGNPAQITITIQDNDTNCPNVCLGGNVVNSCTGNLVETCSFSCGSGICIPPPSPELLNWNVLPRLVHRGDSVTLTWSTDYTESCAIQRSNGATWTGLNTTGTRTDTIQQETTYVLSCLGLDETTLTSPAITVRIVPDWQEI